MNPIKPILCVTILEKEKSYGEGKKTKMIKVLEKCKSETLHIKDGFYKCKTCGTVNTVVKCSSCGRNIIRNTSGCLNVCVMCDNCSCSNMMPGYFS